MEQAGEEQVQEERGEPYRGRPDNSWQLKNLQQGVKKVTDAQASPKPRLLHA